MKERIGKERIERKVDYLYYVGKDGYVWEKPFGKEGEKRKRVGMEKICREEGYVYYLDREGYVARFKKGETFWKPEYEDFRLWA